MNCVVAGDATLSGSPASALYSAETQSIGILERTYGGSFQPVAGQIEIEGLLSQAGPGARGIVLGGRNVADGHVFNAINEGGVIRFLDYQSGTVASFEGYDWFGFLWTSVP